MLTKPYIGGGEHSCTHQIASALCQWSRREQKKGMCIKYLSYTLVAASSCGSGIVCLIIWNCESPSTCMVNLWQSIDSILHIASSMDDCSHLELYTQVWPQYWLYGCGWWPTVQRRTSIWCLGRMPICESVLCTNKCHYWQELHGVCKCTLWFNACLCIYVYTYVQYVLNHWYCVCTGSIYLYTHLICMYVYLIITCA